MKALLIILGIAILYVFWSGVRNQKKSERKEKDKNSVTLSTTKTVPFKKESNISFCERMNSYLNCSLNSFRLGDDWEKQQHIDGTPMLVKSVSLSPMVLGLFDVVVVSMLDNGITYYDFLSKKYAPNDGLRKFISSCYLAFGPDKQKQGICSQSDIEPLKVGRFTRDWENINILQTKRADHLSLVMALRITLKD